MDGRGLLVVENLVNVQAFSGSMNMKATQQTLILIMQKLG